jgi:hypothetical protein
MQKRGHFMIFIAVFVFTLPYKIMAQQTGNRQDTFFLAKKKGLIGKLGKSISTNAPEDIPLKVENQYIQFKGKIIRSIELVRLGFESSIYDTNTIKNTFGIRVANALHKNSHKSVIKHNLFFKEGSILYPYLVADNERYLRDLPYIQDARIVVLLAEGSTDSVDVLVLTKDIFSLGAKLKLNSKTKGRVEVQEENLGGRATKILLGGFYDETRHDQKAFSAELTKRNIGGSFIDWTAGYSNYAPAFSSGRREETHYFTRLEKPLVTPYIPTTGSIEAGYYTTNNAYVSDSLYQSDFRYQYYNIDGWLGYNLGSKRSLYVNRETRVHTFIALRAFNQHFNKLPIKYSTVFDYRFTNYTGVLTSLNIFRQVFYKTNFIYGFGRNEDVAEGFSAVFTSGWIKTQQAKRPYGGLDFDFSHFNKAGFFTNYTFKAGGYFYRNRFEDMELLFNVAHFTRLKKLNSYWYQRTFISTGITAQINPVFNAPLFINSDYGLPYFTPDNIHSDLRSTVKLESVYYNTKKVLGFRFAPFIFADLTLLKPSKLNFDKTDLYSAVGGGIRTRNENLVFGTIELKGYYFPRTNGNMREWKIELSSNIRFKYNSSFIKRPDFIKAN